MANWLQTLTLAPEWDAAQAGKIDHHIMAGLIALRLRALDPSGDEYIDEQRDELVDSFEHIAESDEADVQDFDCVMSDLYDWGDTRLEDGKVCWIKTF